MNNSGVFDFEDGFLTLTMEISEEKYIDPIDVIEPEDEDDRCEILQERYLKEKKSDLVFLKKDEPKVAHIKQITGSSILFYIFTNEECKGYAVLDEDGYIPALKIFDFQNRSKGLGGLLLEALVEYAINETDHNDLLLEAVPEVKSDLKLKSKLFDFYERHNFKRHVTHSFLRKLR